MQPLGLPAAQRRLTMIWPSHPALPARVITMKLKLALLCSLGLAAGQAMACYTVYDAGNQVVYNAQTPPVDTRLPLSQTLPRGHHMVFDDSSSCPRVQPTAQMALPPASKPSPLLTDQRTARAMKLPHTVLASGAVLVPQRPDSMGSGVVVVASTPALVVPDTSVMGAAAAPAAARRNEVVITELHDPPLTGVQMNGLRAAPLR